MILLKKENGEIIGFVSVKCEVMINFDGNTTTDFKLRKDVQKEVERIAFLLSQNDIERKLKLHE